MDKNVILVIAEAILANTKVLQTLVESLPKEAREEVAKTVTAAVPVSLQAVVKAEIVTGNVAPTPPVQPAPTPVVPVTVTPTVAVAPVFATPAAVSPFSAVFANQAELTAFVMDTYKSLGPIKGAKIQEVLNSVGAKNINEVKPEMYAAVKAGVEALKA